MKSLRQLRKEAELTQSELAQKLGVDQTYISKLEHGIIPLGDSVLQMKLCEALGLPLSEVAPEKCSDRRFPVAVHGKIVHSMTEYFDAVKENSEHCEACRKDLEQMIQSIMKPVKEAIYLTYTTHLSLEESGAFCEAFRTGKDREKWDKDWESFVECVKENWDTLVPKMLDLRKKYLEMKNSQNSSESAKREHIQ